MMNRINSANPIKSLPVNISDQGAITGMTLSKDGTLLATFSSTGSIKIWDIQDDFKLLRKIRDSLEDQIDEFYCGQFIGDCIITAGKLKDRHRWSVEDNDNHILPCPIKIFNATSTERVARLEGHSEEILCVKTLTFKSENYLISTSQDGYIMKWHMNETWTKLIKATAMLDGITCMAFTVSFVPNTGNKYFIAACDEQLKLFDFEQAMVLQTFPEMYSSYCDCGKFIRWLDEPTKDESNVEFAWFISRGAEMCNLEDGISSKPNTCILHKLVYPTKVGSEFVLETVQKFMHQDYHSNSWLVKITSNGRYILAPTIYGQIFVFNIATAQVTAILKEHVDMEVRDVIFHSYKPLLFSSCDDGSVKVYAY